MSLATPLPPAYSKSCSTTKSYQPFISTSDKRFTTPSKRSRWSRKVKNEERLPYAGPYSSDEKSLASSRTNSSSATSTRTTSTSDSTSLESSPASKSTKSTKSSRSWFKRVLLGASDEELNEDPEAKRMEKNAMWWNLSMGYEVSPDPFPILCPTSRSSLILVVTKRTETSPSCCRCSSGKFHLITGAILSACSDRFATECTHSRGCWGVCWQGVPWCLSLDGRTAGGCAGFCVAFLFWGLKESRMKFGNMKSAGCDGFPLLYTQTTRIVDLTDRRSYDSCSYVSGIFMSAKT
ncbi:hypothetical protein DOTSEDRAFT_71809 [Dothistroma septosporum NZE10]|uniref:Uncharacterized protein n=1 Tax=Dothistroma septosporum (strain NZE10 / CBS 128990) TaxID=675120 RepID=N1PNW5_DOTSN|nr:hypothetical protein DOTSEDRAFT_71809 [Dothistroma septosporum NZE10]